MPYPGPPVTYCGFGKGFFVNAIEELINFEEIDEI